MQKSGTTGVGDVAPEFKLATADGHEVALSALTGRQVVLFFVREFT